MYLLRSSPSLGLVYSIELSMVISRLGSVRWAIRSRHRSHGRTDSVVDFHDGVFHAKMEKIEHSFGSIDSVSNFILLDFQQSHQLVQNF